MYEVDGQDVVVELPDVPQSSIGAPLPHVVADEHHVAVVFYLQDPDPDWEGHTVRVIGPDTEGEPIAIVAFHRPMATMFGPPNDEAFSGHPLASRGLGPYGAFRAEQSSWIRRLERMNSVHPYHRPEEFWKLSHYVLSFHDNAFECIAESYTVHRTRGSVRAAAISALAELGRS